MNNQEMINLLKNDLKNEYHHMHFYLWCASAVIGLHREELSEFFSDAAKSEMEHIKEFTHILNGLDCKDYRINQHINMPQHVISDINMLQYAIEIESSVVQNYHQRIKDAENWDCSDGKFITIFLENQLLDSRNDAIHMGKMLDGLSL